MQLKEALNEFEQLKEASYIANTNFNRAKLAKPAALPIGVHHIVHSLENINEYQIDINDRAFRLISRLINEGVKK